MCGIFGWHGNDMRTYNPYKIAMLGLLNDSRGGDGCGLSVNGQIKKETGKINKFSEFLNEETLKFLMENKENTVLGHARKTSVGQNSIENTHPFGHGDFKNGYETILTHNGTIYNYTDLAEKYKIDVKDKTDSYLLSKLLHEDFNSFLKFLEEYNGGAAIAAYDRSQDMFILFKGKSKKFDTSKEEEEERPLSLAFVNNYNFYYSSESNHLLAIGFNPKKIINLKPNVVIIFKNGKVIKEFDINRSKSCQSKPYKQTSVFTYPPYGYIYDTYDSYDDYYYDKYYRQNNKITKYEPNSNTTKVIKYEYSKIDSGKQIIFRKNRYYIFDKDFVLANGYCYVDNSGKTVDYSVFNNCPNVKYLYFKDGIAYCRYSNNIDKHLIKNNSELLAYPVFTSRKRSTYIINPGKNNFELHVSRKEGYIPLFDMDEKGNLIGFLGQPIVEDEKRIVKSTDLYAIYDSYVISKNIFIQKFNEEILKTKPKDALDAFEILRTFSDDNLDILMEEGSYNLDELKNTIRDEYNII